MLRSTSKWLGTRAPQIVGFMSPLLKDYMTLERVYMVHMYTLVGL